MKKVNCTTKLHFPNSEYESMHKKLKFSIKDFFSKCDQIHSFLRIWSHVLKKFLIQNFLCSAYCIYQVTLNYFRYLNSFVTINAVNGLEQINWCRYTIPSTSYLFLSFFVAASTSYIHDTKIKAKILNGYDKSTRPYIDNEILKVAFDMKIQKIVKFVRGSIFILNFTEISSLILFCLESSM